ncbi:MAG: pyridoxal phosphate-dependent aminotransferase [Candidatus Hodarchaeales archaeon]|jgi:aspartate/methionine/tyrosine aminotransferase
MLSNQLKKLEGSSTAKFFRLANEREALGHDIIHLEIGQPDFQPSQEIINETFNAIKQGKTDYAISPGIPELRQSITSAYKEDFNVDINPNGEIIITSGAKQGILNAIFALLNRGDRLIIQEPYWVSYPDMITLSGGIVEKIPMKNDFTLNFEALKELISEKEVRAVLINTPNNPSGHVMNSEEFSFIKDLIEDYNIKIIADEIYNEYIYIPSPFKTILSELKDWRDHIVVVNGFSKTFSMTGFRLGYTIANEELSQGILRLVQASTSCATTFCQWAAIKAIETRHNARKLISDIFPRRRQLLIEEVEKTDGLSIKAIDGAFYGFIKYTFSDEPSDKVAEDILMNANVAIIPGSGFGSSAEGFFRVAFSRSEGEIKEAFKRIREYIKS